MGFLNKLFGGKEKKTGISPEAGPGDKTSSPGAGLISGKGVELSEEERNLLGGLGIAEEAGLQLKSLTKQKLEGLYQQFWADSDKEPVLRGIRSGCGKKEKTSFAKQLNRNELNPDIHFFGCGGYAGEKNYYVGAVKTMDRYDILRIMETDGVNHDVFTENIIHFLKKWEERISFSIAECEADAVVLQLEDMNVELQEFAAEALAICPDLVSGFEMPADLIRYIKDNKGQIEFWWD
jgi:hypothetical protein